MTDNTGYIPLRVSDRQSTLMASPASGTRTEGANDTCDICASRFLSGDARHPCGTCGKILCVSCRELKTKVQLMTSNAAVAKAECSICRILLNLKRGKSSESKDSTSVAAFGTFGHDTGTERVRGFQARSGDTYKLESRENRQSDGIAVKADHRDHSQSGNRVDKTVTMSNEAKMKNNTQLRNTFQKGTPKEGDEEKQGDSTHHTVGVEQMHFKKGGNSDDLSNKGMKHNETHPNQVNKRNDPGTKMLIDQLEEENISAQNLRSITVNTISNDGAHATDISRNEGQHSVAQKQQIVAYQGGTALWKETSSKEEERKQSPTLADSPNTLQNTGRNQRVYLQEDDINGKKGNVSVCTKPTEVTVRSHKDERSNIKLDEKRSLEFPNYSRHDHSGPINLENKAENGTGFHKVKNKSGSLKNKDMYEGKHGNVVIEQSTEPVSLGVYVNTFTPKDLGKNTTSCTSQTNMEEAEDEGQQGTSRQSDNSTVEAIQVQHDNERKSKTKSLRSARKKQSKHLCAGCGRRDCDGQFMKLLKEMIQTAKKNNFEIRNVVPDGNCMFAAIVDQLDLVGNHGNFSQRSLRQAAVEYLRAHPTSEDGTHYMMFMDGEDWEDYLTRMTHDGQWGDHLILQAIAQVTKSNIRVLNGSDDKGMTDIKTSSATSGMKPLYLGHVGELHYVSLRPASAEEILVSGETNEEMDEEELISLSTPSSIDPVKKHMFLEDFVDPFSDTPALHFGFLVKKFLPLSEVLAEADRYASTALSFEVADEAYDDESGGTHKPAQQSQFPLKVIGDIIDGLFAGKLEENKKPELDTGANWTDVTVLQICTSIMAVPSGSETKSPEDVTMETDKVHPGYTRLVAQYPDRWGQREKSASCYVPNSHEKFNSLKTSAEMKEQVSSHNPYIMSLFKDFKVAIPLLFWPQEASEWMTRIRPYNWPAQTLVQSIVSEGCHLVADPHPKSSNPDVEFKISFGAAERSLCTDGLIREQRYCYIAFKALCFQEFKGNSLIQSEHLRSVFFYACEVIPAECWSAKLGGCLFYLLDDLIHKVESRNLPCYFMKTNNLIDHLTTEEFLVVVERLNNLRYQPMQHFMSFKMTVQETEAMNILQNVRDDIESNFLVHLDVRKSVLECFVPMSIDMARRCIGKKNYKIALEEVQAAYEERLTVATCEDSLPFVAFLNEVVSTIDFAPQWWFLLYTDEKLGTTLSCDISMSNEPMALSELVGEEVAKEYSSTLIPNRLAVYPCTFSYDFAFYLFMKYRTAQAISCLQLCIQKHQQLLSEEQYYTQGQSSEEHNPTLSDFSDRNMLKIYIFLYLCCTRMKKYDVISQYIQLFESLCAKRGTQEPYYQLSVMWKSLGYDEESERALRQYQQLPAGDGDVVESVSKDILSQSSFL